MATILISIAVLQFIGILGAVLLCRAAARSEPQPGKVAKAKLQDSIPRVSLPEFTRTKSVRL
jgi:hypothetical protein